MMNRTRATSSPESSLRRKPLPPARVRELLAAITSDGPDVIVSDIAMPVEDGYDLIRILRELSPTLRGQSRRSP